MTTIEKKSLKVGKFVNTAHVDNVIRNYKQERWIQNSERIGKEDSLSAWWSIEELEQFLETAKVHGGDGVKFYFGAYDNDYAENPDYAGRQTLAMVATKQKETGSGRLINKDLYVQGKNGSNILAYNAATLCPPYCLIVDPSNPDPTFDPGITIDPLNRIGITLIDNGDDGMMVI